MDQFTQFRKRMFENLEGNQIKLFFKFLVELVDIRAEKLKMPSYMCQQKDKMYYYSLERGEDFHKFNRKSIITMLLIALADKEPTTNEFDKIK